MKMTLEQVNEDIKSGKSKIIYYSSGSAWWTHLDDDVSAATEAGKLAAEKDHEKFMDRKDVPVAEKQRVSNLFESSKNSTIPLDVIGRPLFMTHEPAEFMRQAMSKPDHYGEHKLDAFMKSHHQNCNNRASIYWSFYNGMIDSEKLRHG